MKKEKIWRIYLHLASLPDNKCKTNEIIFFFFFSQSKIENTENGSSISSII